MENDPILCFQHCRTDANILCMKVPEQCPICRGDTNTTPMKIPPFRLPSPFVHSREVPYSVVVRPTLGTFLRDYTKVCNLHVGITDSRGVVYDFDENGLNKQPGGWEQCVAVYSLARRDAHTRSMWNVRLLEFSSFSQWLPHRYSENTHNCYDFVLEFIHQMALEERVPAAKNKGTFCDQLLAPAVLQASKYIALYRKLLQESLSVRYTSQAEDNTMSTEL